MKGGLNISENTNKKLKILCIGDQHFKVSNIPNVDIFIKKLEECIKEIKPDIIVSMGDLLDTHERLHTEPLNKAVEYLEMLSSNAETFALVGNHDFVSNSQFLTTKHWLNCVKPKFRNSQYKDCLTIVDNIKIANYSDIKLVFCPYVPEGRFVEALNTRKGEWEDANCIFGHQLFNGAKMGSIISDNVEQWEENFPFLICGHIHDKQRVQKNLYYTGSSMQHAFNESFEKTILLVTIKGKEILESNLKEIDLKLPKKKTIYLNSQELDDFDIGKLNEGTEYKITVHGNQEEYDSFKKTNKYKQITKLAKINFKPKRADILEQKELLKNKNDINNGYKSFSTILEELVKNEKDIFLEAMFNTYICGRKKDESVDDEIEITLSSDESDIEIETED